jgi:hypothetical protein
MKLLLGGFLGLTILFLAASVYLGLQASEMRAAAWDAGNRGYENSRSQLTELHMIVMGYSLPYFALGLAAFMALALKSGATVWRIGGGFGALVALGMIGWTLLLSGAISFDETYPAWIVAGVLLGALGVAALVGGTQGGRQPRAHR